MNAQPAGAAGSNGPLSSDPLDGEPLDDELVDEVIDDDLDDDLDDPDDEDDSAVAPGAGAGGGPGVVVVHDWYGPLPHVADFADELTMAGFDVELVDMYDGVTTRDPGRAEALADDLDDDAARRLIAAAGKRLRAAGSAHVGVVGFSLGGWLALRTAGNGRFDAVVAYYATADLEVAAEIGCPVQLHLAADDEFESADDVESFVRALRAASTPVDTFTYRGTEHSFANADVELSDPGAAEVALARTIGFLHARLAG
ncbi:dienelactone hydrolase family protein [Pengzhenrongella sicca]|uniref:Dienelactone hydrolase family protein n=1 Tax=Pengzhenrongella sicca TaxID=2819238 RepID=A0A8A4ZE05_9MICO|nr:dienelactone hydrolase family protein [Pengzhenrongella sicca]QTE28717.1 dienelactone hydrolase family protein [Pengzhenrongella sicca]